MQVCPRCRRTNPAEAVFCHFDGAELRPLHDGQLPSPTTQAPRLDLSPRRLILGTLQAGETRAVTFRLGADAFSLYDRQMRKVVEPGTFTIFVGGNSIDVTSAHVEITGGTLVLAPATPRFR